MPRHPPKLTLDDIDYLDGMLDPLDELPDGLWQEACENAIAESSRFKGRDAYEIWIQWTRASGRDE